MVFLYLFYTYAINIGRQLVETIAQYENLKYLKGYINIAIIFENQ